MFGPHPAVEENERVLVHEKTNLAAKESTRVYRGPSVELPRSYLQAGNVRHAYALTGHAAQGITVERAFALGAGEARLQEWGYLALSRARTETLSTSQAHRTNTRATSTT
jgi:hypothetical protein